MNISTTAALGSIDTSSRLIHPFSDTTIPKDPSTPVGSAANGPSLWRSIFNTQGKEILECASDQFLDHAIALRLETVSARHLVDLLAKAERLRYIESNIVEDNADEPLAHEANGSTRHSLRTDSTSKCCFLVDNSIYSLR
jgi:hypothetical protein